MARYLAIALFGITFAGLPMIAGCDKDKETSKTVDEHKNADGSSSLDKKETTVNPKTGDAKITEEHKVTGPTTNP